jgi:hypothetical protein
MSFIASNNVCLQNEKVKKVTHLFIGGVMKEVEIREGKTAHKPLKAVKKTLDTAVYVLFTFSLCMQSDSLQSIRP